MEIPEEIKKKIEYQQFVEWIGLPGPEREPKTQEEFGLKLGVDVATLSCWKKTEGFWDLVRIERKKWAKDKVSDVLMGLYRTAVLEGKAAEAKLFMQYAEEFEEKSVLEIKGKIERKLNDEDRKLIKRALGYAGLKEPKVEELKKEETKEETKDVKQIEV